MKKYILFLLLLFLLMPVATAMYDDAIGFAWNTSVESPTVTRVFANGSVAAVDGDYFNNHALWGNIKKVLVNRTSQQVFYGSNNRGDGLNFTGLGFTAGNQTMIEIPRFYEFNSYTGTTLTYLQCSYQYNASFTVAPMFNQRMPVGATLPALHYYIGAYDMSTETYNGATTGTSYTGKTPVVSQTIGTMRTYAERNGNGWGLMNYWSWVGLRQLFYTEMGTLNSQVAWEGSRGVVDNVYLGTPDGYISGANSTDTSIYAINATGNGTGINGKTPAVYRGIENLWGNVWQFADGQNSYTGGGNSYWRNINRTGFNLTGGRTVYRDLLISGDYETATTTTIGDGYQRNVANGEGVRGMFIPTSVTGGADSKYLADYYYYPRSASSSTPTILVAGGGWKNAGGAGVGSWSSGTAASGSDLHVGARPEFRANNPVANFSYTVTNPLTVAVTFTDTTINNPTKWEWYYTNATGTKVLFSNLQNPTYTFGDQTWQIELNVTNVDSTSTKVMTLPMISIFIANSTTNYAGDIIQFVDGSVGGVTGWNWSFGDGTFSNLQNPTHEYLEMGDYSVILNVSREVY